MILRVISKWKFTVMFCSVVLDSLLFNTGVIGGIIYHVLKSQWTVSH